MPAPMHGEAVQLIETGDYDAVITQVICLGHQAWKEKEVTKFWVELFIPSLNISKPLSNFGINTWLSPSRPPFVGFYELITATTNEQNPSKDFLNDYDLFDVAGKSVTLTFDVNEKGYMNIVGVKPYTGTASLKTEEEIIKMGVEDFKNEELMEKISDKPRQMIWTSREFQEGDPFFANSKTVSAKNDIKKTTLEEVPDEIKISDVPF